jgi:hypothetical protein
MKALYILTVSVKKSRKLVYRLIDRSSPATFDFSYSSVPVQPSTTMPKAQPSAISQRNPLGLVQQPRKRQSKGSTKSLSDATKASYAAATEAHKQSNATLEEEFSTIFTKREEQITYLSEKYKRQPKYIHQVLENSTHYTGKHVPSLKNAIWHHFLKKARESEWLALGAQKFTLEASCRRREQQHPRHRPQG